MTDRKRVRRERTETIGRLLHEYAAALGRSVRRTLIPAIHIVRFTRHRDAAARISRRLMTPH
jgi:hypothetical protein